MPNGSGFKPDSQPKNPREGDQPMITAASSTGCCGSCGLGRPGEISPSAMAPGARWPVASTAGRELGSGRSSWRLCKRKPTPMAKLTGTFIMSMAP
jgi:hypothetical protein